jgi:hypothetical protein
LPAIKLGNRNSLIRVPVPTAHGGHKALLFLPGYGGIGCEILAAVRETRLSAENSHCQGDVGSWPLADTPVSARRGSFRGKSGHHGTTAS